MARTRTKTMTTKMMMMTMTTRNDQYWPRNIVSLFVRKFVAVFT